MQEESDPTPAPSTPALCQAIPRHCGWGREKDEKEPRRPKDRATAGSSPILTLPEALHSLTHKLSSEWGAWPWKYALAQIPASITSRSATAAAVPAHQLHPERTHGLGEATRAGWWGRLGASHSSRTRKWCIGWRLQRLPDNLQWHMAPVHQHKADTASHWDHLKVSGRWESSQQKGWGKETFDNEREHKMGKQKAKQEPTPICFLCHDRHLSPLKMQQAVRGLQFITYLVWWNWGRCCVSCQPQGYALQFLSARIQRARLPGSVPATWERLTDGQEPMFYIKTIITWILQDNMRIPVIIYIKRMW